MAPLLLLLLLLLCVLCCAVLHLLCQAVPNLPGLGHHVCCQGRVGGERIRQRPFCVGIRYHTCKTPSYMSRKERLHTKRTRELECLADKQALDIAWGMPTGRTKRWGVVL